MQSPFDRNKRTKVVCVGFSKKCSRISFVSGQKVLFKVIFEFITRKEVVPKIFTEFPSQSILLAKCPVFCRRSFQKVYLFWEMGKTYQIEITVKLKSYIVLPYSNCIEKIF